MMDNDDDDDDVKMSFFSFVFMMSVIFSIAGLMIYMLLFDDYIEKLAEPKPRKRRRRRTED